MKRLFDTFLTLLISCFSISYATTPQPISEQIEQDANVAVTIIDKNSPSKNEVVHELLSLQKSLIVSSQNPIPEKFMKTGFLIVPMTPGFVLHLLDEKDGLVVCAYIDKRLVGYILLTDTSEFKELYQDKNVGRFDTSIDRVAMNAWLDDQAVGYIEQIAVKPGYSRMGIGSKLIAKSKEIKPKGLIADVFIYPVKNHPSVLFFSNQDFFQSGILYQYPIANANFPYAHQTQVFFWNLIGNTYDH